MLAAIALAGCGSSASSSSGVAKIGPKTITRAQLLSTLAIGRAQYRQRHIPFPKPGSAEYRLLTQQALAYLTQKSQAAQADSALGVKPTPLLVSPSSFAKVTSSVHVTDAEVLAYYKTHHGRGFPPTPARDEAIDIRTQLRNDDQKAAMKAWLADVRKRFPISYAPGYAPVRPGLLARQVWKVPPRGRCDLPVGTYSFAVAAKHRCLGDDVPALTLTGEAPCALIDFPTGAPNGFSSAEENSGYANYLENTAPSCTPDPRTTPVQVTADMVAANEPPVPVSYLRATGSRRFEDGRYGWTATYPARWHVYPIVVQTLDSTVEGIEIANYAAKDVSPSRPVAPGAVDFTFTRSEGGIVDLGPGHPRDTALPLRLGAFRRTNGARWLPVQAEGATFTAAVRTGASPSAADLAALKAIVASIRFPLLHTGTVAPSGYFVLGRAAAYPPGSVTRIAGFGTIKPFFLVHDRTGFWIVRRPEGHDPGYGCAIRLDRTKRRFTCPNGAAWSLDGHVLVNPKPSLYQDEELLRSIAPVSVDGHILVD